MVWGKATWEISKNTCLRGKGQEPGQSGTSGGAGTGRAPPSAVGTTPGPSKHHSHMDLAKAQQGAVCHLSLRKGVLITNVPRSFLWTENESSEKLPLGRITCFKSLHCLQLFF